MARLGASSKGAKDEPAGEELDYYRSIVKCTLCKVNEKNCIINKCGHVFCRQCIEQRLNLRNRKCPGCSQQFDYQAVKDIYLTN